MDAQFQAESSATHFVNSKEAAAVATMSRVRSRFFPNHPTIFEAVKLDADQAWYFDFYDKISNLGRVVVVPPNMPPAQLAYMQAAMKETLANPQLISDGERTERIIEYLDAERTLANARGVISDPTPAQRALVQSIISGIQDEPAK
jgi:hypothetical protein